VDLKKKAKHGDIMGATAFVLFTGVSILPKELTFGDCLTRGVAAFYLRRRSKSFRDWVASVEGAHLATWVIRACLLLAAFRAAAEYDVSTKSDGKMSPAAATACAAATAALLRFAERRSERRTKKHKTLFKDGRRVFTERAEDGTAARVARVSTRERRGSRRTLRVRRRGVVSRYRARRNEENEAVGARLLARRVARRRVFKTFLDCVPLSKSVSIDAISLVPADATADSDHITF
jgi:hypothetical protein